MSTNVLKLASELAKPFEGLFLYPYYCPAHYPTVGYGHLLSTDTKAPLSSFKGVTLEEAEELLQKDMESVLRGVLFNTKGITLNDNQLAALTDFVFNLGANAFKESTLLKYLRANNFIAASNEFKKWNNGGGKVLPGLVKRRKAEEDLFNKP